MNYGTISMSQKAYTEGSLQTLKESHDIDISFFKYRQFDSTLYLLFSSSKREYLVCYETTKINFESIRFKAESIIVTIEADNIHIKDNNNSFHIICGDFILIDEGKYHNTFLD